jgi:hypothetical protein
MAKFGGKPRDHNMARAIKRADERTGLVCQWCGKPLQAARSTARFCSPAHRWRMWKSTHDGATAGQ